MTVVASENELESSGEDSDVSLNNDEFDDTDQDSDSGDDSLPDDKADVDNEVENIAKDNANDESDSDDEEESNDSLEDRDEDKEDGDDEDDDEDENDDDEGMDGNKGWADAMAKVLAMGKNSEKPVSVLSKAKKDNVKQKTKSAENADKNENENTTETTGKFEPLAVRKAKKREIDSIGRVMPNILEKNSERVLAKIATRGVVQLFNAVREQQKDIKDQLKSAGGSFRKQEKVLQNIDKNSFVELLTGKSVNIPNEEPPSKKSKLKAPDENESSWNILRDDFMLGAKMRDWDKESDDE